VERIKGTLRRAAPRVYNPSSLSAAHLNQKPLEFMRRIVSAVTEPGEVVWEPFGGLASAAVAAVEAGRIACVAEIDHDFAEIAAQRLADAAAGRDQDGTGSLPR
jgi:DNA modification methylase